MKKIVSNYEEMIALVDPLQAEQKYVIDVAELSGGSYSVQWIEQKQYTAFDGTRQADEAWLTEDDRLIMVQDLDVDHCKNILRMLIRQDREAFAAMQDLGTQISQAMAQAAADDEVTFETSADANLADRVLH